MSLESQSFVSTSSREVPGGDHGVGAALVTQEVDDERAQHHLLTLKIGPGNSNMAKKKKKKSKTRSQDLWNDQKYFDHDNLVYDDTDEAELGELGDLSDSSDSTVIENFDPSAPDVELFEPDDPSNPYTQIRNSNKEVKYPDLDNVEESQGQGHQPSVPGVQPLSDQGRVRGRGRTRSGGTAPTLPPRPKSPLEKDLSASLKLARQHGKQLDEYLDVNTELIDNLKEEAVNYSDERQVLIKKQELLDQKQQNADLQHEIKHKLIRVKDEEDALYKSGHDANDIFQMLQNIGQEIQSMKKASEPIINRLSELEQQVAGQTSQEPDNARMQPPVPPRRGSRTGAPAPRRGSPRPSSSSSSSSSDIRGRGPGDRGEDHDNARGHGRLGPGRTSRSGGHGAGGGDPGYDPHRGGRRHRERRPHRQNGAGGGGGDPDPGDRGGGGGGDRHSDSGSGNQSPARSLFNLQDPAERLIFRMKLVLKRMKKALRRHPEARLLLESERQRGDRLMANLDQEVGNLQQIGPHQLNSITDLSDKIENISFRIILQIELIDQQRAESSRAARSTLPQFNGEPVEFISFGYTTEYATNNMYVIS